MTHGFHKIVLRFAFCRIYIQFLLREVAKLWVLFLHVLSFLAPCTFVKQIGLEEPFKLHDDHGEVCPFEALREHFAEKAHHSLVKGLIVLRIVRYHTLELNETVNLVS